MAQLDGKRAVQHLERLHAAWLVRARRWAGGADDAVGGAAALAATGAWLLAPRTTFGRAFTFCSFGWWVPFLPGTWWARQADPAAFGDVGGFAFIIGNSEEEMSYSKILAFQVCREGVLRSLPLVAPVLPLWLIAPVLPPARLQIWIFGYEVPDTLVAVTKAGVTFVTSAKKIKFLQPLLKHGGRRQGVTRAGERRRSLTSCPRATGSTLTFTFLERGADNAAAFTKVQAALGASGKFGDFGPKNAGVGAFASEWHAFVTGGCVRGAPSLFGVGD